MGIHRLGCLQRCASTAPNSRQPPPPGFDHIGSSLQSFGTSRRPSAYTVSFPSLSMWSFKNDLRSST